MHVHWRSCRLMALLTEPQLQPFYAPDTTADPPSSLPLVPPTSAQALAGSQRVACQELLRVQAPSPLALDRQNFQSITATTDHQSGFVRLEDLTGLARDLCDLSFPDFEQVRLRLAWQM